MGEDDRADGPEADDAGRPEPDDGTAEDGPDARATGTDGDDRPEVRNPFAEPSDADAAGTERHSLGDADAPFAGLAAETRERRRRRRRREDAGDDPFERVEVSEVDAEALWASLDDADPDPGGVAECVGDDGDDDDPRPEHVVDKREYCQRCRYLSAPPELSCGHEGTDIVEATDAGHFRVRGCPMVTDDEGPPNFRDH